VSDLPEGYSYRIISRHGDEMDDGFRAPHRLDGMATFPGPEATTLLVRNHEIELDAPLAACCVLVQNHEQNKVSDRLGTALCQ